MTEIRHQPSQTRPTLEEIKEALKDLDLSSQGFWDEYEQHLSDLQESIRPYAKRSHKVAKTLDNA